MLQNRREVVVLVPIIAELYDDDGATYCSRVQWPSLDFVGKCAESSLACKLNLELWDTGMSPLNYESLSFDKIFMILEQRNDQYTNAYVFHQSHPSKIIMSGWRAVGEREWQIKFISNGTCTITGINAVTQMRLIDAGIREQEWARSLVIDKKVHPGVDYEFMLSHGIYDSSLDCILLTVNGVSYSYKVNRP